MNCLIGPIPILAKIIYMLSVATKEPSLHFNLQKTSGSMNGLVLSIVTIAVVLSAGGHNVMAWSLNLQTKLTQQCIERQR
mmetsp:Transcript_30723/g.57518  ORF Transcript_30723/g.57518 Transcript_30723/m.57518 type:complete len:80 (-) Transcript_30723:210-449(-)